MLGHTQSPRRRFLVDLALLGASVILFVLAFPSFLSAWGFPPLAFIAFLPIPLVIRRNGYLAAALLGMLYGYASYALFNYWLAKFHPLAHIIVPVVYGAFFVLLFPLLKGADDLFPKSGHLVQIVVWLTYEYVRTLGFLGYSYGTIGYSQYLFLPLARFASLTGVLGVSAIVAFPSFYLGRLLLEMVERAPIRALPFESPRRKFELVGYLVLVAGVLTYGFSRQTEFSDETQWRVALVQQNVDPWKGGDRAYQRSLEIHTELSEQAEVEDPDIVIWSETAFVPSISWHTRFRTDSSRFEIVRRLTQFLDGRSVPYVIGNGDGQLADPAQPPIDGGGRWNRTDYNAVLMYEHGQIIDTYRKLHLVPFTEYFPFKEQLPRIYRWLEAADTHFWEKGNTYTVFDTGDVTFSTPICYEDTFGYISRGFVRAGAAVIVNITNDSWSSSVAAEMQHMAMSVFRALENERTLVRSTNGGITCTIEPDGQITNIIEPFTEGYLVADVPVYEGTRTLYTRLGDWFGIFVSFSALILLLGGSLYRWWRHRPN